MPQREVTAHYSFGGGSLDGEALENALRTTVPVHIDRVNYAAGGAGATYHARNGLVAGPEVQTIVDQDAGDGYETALGLGYGLFNLGYAFRLGRVVITPLIGVGGGGIGLDLKPIADGGAAAVAEELRGLRLSRSNFLVHIGLGVEVRVGGRFGLTVGGRAGVVFAPFSNREGIRGPYIRGIFGGGARL